LSLHVHAISQSALDPASAQASSIAGLWWLMLVVATAVFVIVLGFIAVAIYRSSTGRTSAAAGSTSEHALTRSVEVAVALTVLILIGLLVASIITERATESVQASSALTIEITGHQWWWEIQYDDAVPSRRVTTANEVHIPIGRPVVFKVTSRDVIHSFWVPNLQGKRDLIPGMTTAIWMKAERAGIFRGQCAEFCGLQHARMALEVIAEPEADFGRWLEGMRQPAREPLDAATEHGRAVFMQARCATCHKITGTDANGQVAPDLTHVGARRTLAAGTLPNTREHLAEWIRDPQASKPGNQMPPNPLPRADMDALVQYLTTLQ
jgi:cytochrome c oxidase subunit II